MRSGGLVEIKKAHVGQPVEGKRKEKGKEKEETDGKKETDSDGNKSTGK
jgi:hypothetical protein